MKNKFSLSFLVFSVVIGVDQLTKWWARGQGGVVLNEGVSFGLGQHQSVWVFVVLTGLVLLSLFLLFKEIWQKNMVMFGVLSGAAMSNVLDRLIWGGVQDFLPIPILRLQNNIADWVIFACLVWLGWRLLLRKPRI
ncbi:MAG: signal peptidase II [Patescibacteria group bacterium]